jgi:aerobic-type carbon monoxide dehydrogenase small subunit (CoxS/CutS family)
MNPGDRGDRGSRREARDGGERGDRGDRERRGLTRRSLLQGVGLAAGGALLGARAAAAEEPTGPRVQGPGAVPLTLRVNGSERAVQAEPRETLLEVLRRGLDLTGAKPVCDRSQCGACTVWLDGATVHACGVLAVEAEGREITTVEGLGTPSALHPVQRAFVEADALQCGFCTPGLVMSCAWAVRTHGAALTEAQVREACAGNLCRCGTYPRVLAAALAAAKGR